MADLKIHFQRISTGATAGFTAALAKYYSHDHSHILALIGSPQQTNIIPLLMGYCGGALVLAILGAIVVCWSGETNIKKMFAIGLSAPSLLAAGLPSSDQPTIVRPDNQKANWLIEQVITPAQAQEAQVNSGCIGDYAFTKGFKLFFGLREPTIGYRVVVGSFLNPSDAAAKAKAINVDDPSIGAAVGPRHCDNDYYPVVVGGVTTSLDDAKKLAAKARDVSGVGDVYISPVPAP